ncbi:MAG TPA: CBS domain-containing protein, partial [Ktedonobacterales bacterium]
MPHDAHAAFADRPKLLTVHADVERCAERLRAALTTHDRDGVRAVIAEYHPADLADAMVLLNDHEDLAVFEQLDTAEAAEVLDEVDATTKAALVRATPPARLAALLDELPSDEAADVVQALPPETVEEVLALTTPAAAAAIRTLLAYSPESAGGLMSLDFVAVPEGVSMAQALDQMRTQARAQPGTAPISYVYLTDARGGLAGAVALRRLLGAEPSTLIQTLREEDGLSVPPDMDQEQVANIFARYDLTALPVVTAEEGHRLLGVISADDVIDVLQAEHTEDVLRLAG